MPPQGGRKHPNQDYIQLDTANVLFICGGAFVDLDQIIEQRLGNRMVGYNSEMPKDKEELLGEVRPEDLVKYGQSLNSLDAFRSYQYLRNFLNKN